MGTSGKMDFTGVISAGRLIRSSGGKGDKRARCDGSFFFTDSDSTVLWALAR
jgi:hypothetical protein